MFQFFFINKCNSRKWTQKMFYTPQEVEINISFNFSSFTEKSVMKKYIGLVIKNIYINQE